MSRFLQALTVVTVVSGDPSVATFVERKALELDPTNNNARGRLAQLEAQYNRRPQ